MRGMNITRKAWEEVGRALGMYICFFYILFAKVYKLLHII